MPFLPTFSSSGWVSNPLETVDFMIAHFFETQKSQSHFHKQKVTSYQSLIADSKSFGQLATDIERVFGEFMKTQFENVQIEVRIEGANGEPNNSELQVTIGCTFVDKGNSYTLSHAIELLGTQVKRINRINETGSLT